MSKRKCVFSSELKLQYKMFKPGKESWEAKCEVCDQVISVAHKGKADLEKHLQTAKHKKQIQNLSSTSKIDTFLQTNENRSHIRNIQATEITLVYHTIRHHQSFNSLDCTAPLSRCIYSDSGIAKGMTCSRTKAEAILKNVLGPYALQLVLNNLSQIRYISAATDASNHGAIKMFPLLIQYFNPMKGGIQVHLLDLKDQPNETSDTISNYVYNVLKDNNLLNKLVAFAADNTATNFGGRDRIGVNNVYTKLKSMSNNNNIVGVGCVAHIFNNSVHHAINSLPISLESIVMQFHNHFATFTVRTETLKDVCEQLEIHFKQMLYHSKTRWLSLFPAIERILQMFEPLKAYFLSLPTPPRTLQMFFEDEMNEAYLWLSHSFMAIFQNRIKQTERKDISVNEVMEQCFQIQKSLNERLEQKFCPLKICNVLSKLEEPRVKEFEENMALMYKTAINYVQSWTLYLNEEMHYFKWMTLADDLSWEEVANTIEILAKKNIKLDDDKCFDQFQNFKTFIQQKRNDPNFKNLLAHEKWTTYFNSMNNSEYYSELLILAEYYFAIPGHSANIERVFSLINAQWSKERNKLGIDTITKMMFLQCNINLTCQEFYNAICMETEVLDKVTSSAKYLKQ